MTTKLHSKGRASTRLTSLTAIPLALAGFLLAAAPIQATVFVTNLTGNAAALNGAVASDVTELTWSAADGGGTINLTTIGITSPNANELSMDSDSMGVTNDKWGASQSWTFSLDEDINFLGLGFLAITGGKMSVTSTAWANEATATGTGWTFASTATEGTFEATATTVTSFDFSSAEVSSIVAGTEIVFEETGTDGIQMTSFTIAPVPEPSVALFVFIPVVLCLLRRRR